MYFGGNQAVGFALAEKQVEKVYLFSCCAAAVVGLAVVPCGGGQWCRVGLAVVPCEGGQRCRVRVMYCLAARIITKRRCKGSSYFWIVQEEGGNLFRS